MYSKKEVIELLENSEKRIDFMIEQQRGKHNNTPEIDDAFIKAMKGTVKLYRESVEREMEFDCAMGFKKSTNNEKEEHEKNHK